MPPYCPPRAGNQDVVPGLDVVENVSIGPPWSGRPVGPPPAREVALGHHRLERRVYETPVDRGYDNVSAAACPDVESAAHSRPVCNFGNDALVLQRLGQPRCAPLFSAQTTTVKKGWPSAREPGPGAARGHQPQGPSPSC